MVDDLGYDYLADELLHVNRISRTTKLAEMRQRYTDCVRVVMLEPEPVTKQKT